MPFCFQEEFHFLSEQFDYFSLKRHNTNHIQVSHLEMRCLFSFLTTFCIKSINSCGLSPIPRSAISFNQLAMTSSSNLFKKRIGALFLININYTWPASMEITIKNATALLIDTLSFSTASRALLARDGLLGDRYLFVLPSSPQDIHSDFSSWVYLSHLLILNQTSY